MLKQDILNYLAGVYVMINQTRTTAGVPDGREWGGIMIYTPSAYMSAMVHSKTPESRPLALNYPILFGGIGNLSNFEVVGTYSLDYSGPMAILDTDSDGKPATKEAGTVRVGPFISSNIHQWLDGEYTSSRNYLVYDQRDDKKGGDFILKLWIYDAATDARTEVFWRRVAT